MKHFAFPIESSRRSLIPAHAGIQKERESADIPVFVNWVPAFAGTSGCESRVDLDKDLR